MAAKFLTNIDLTGNQLLNAKLQQVGSDITAAGNTSQIFYNTGTGLVKVSNGTSIDTLTNVLESVSGSGAITASAVSGKNQVIAIAAASGSVPGTMSSSDFSKLASSTSSNTASTIVLRDGSGNFTAGTITAALTGTASNASALNSQAASYYLSRANQTGTQLAATISDLAATVQAYTLNQFAVPTTALAMNSQKITGLADPTNPQDAATKNYVDASASGLDVKGSVRAASPAGTNITVTYNASGGSLGRGQITAAPNTLDGVTLATGNRVLLKDQTAATQNGIYVVTTVGAGSTGVWDRAPDFDQDAEVSAGAFTFVEEGTANGDSGWVLTTNNPITIGGASGTPLAFAQFSSAGSYTQGNGISIAGGVISAVGTANRISVSGTGIDIASTYVGQATITTLGLIGTGTWQGTAVGVAYGGTGGTTAAAAKTNLGFLTRYAQTLATSATAYTVTHSLGTLDVQVVVIEVASGSVVYPDIVAASTTTVTISFAVAPAANAYRVVVTG